MGAHIAAVRRGFVVGQVTAPVPQNGKLCARQPRVRGRPQGSVDDAGQHCVTANLRRSGISPLVPAGSTTKTVPRQKFREITARLSDVEEATGDTANRGRQVMRSFMARSGQRGVTVSMIVERLKAGHIPVSDWSVWRWLVEDDAGKIGRVSHLQWRMRNPDPA